MSGEELKAVAWLYERRGFLPSVSMKAPDYKDIVKLTPLYAHPLPEQPQEGWRTIDSAPKDWTDVMVFSPDHGSFNCGGVFSAFFDAESGDWMTHGIGANMELNPTHWMPLPSPPSTETKESGDA